MRAIGIVLLLISGTSAVAQSHWDHNGSIVSLSASGPNRKFHYQSPRAGLPVTAGTLLFEGKKQGNHYSGTAYVFSSRCRASKYAVAGPVAEDQRMVTMYGKAPIRDANCRVVGYRDDVLVFTFQDETTGSVTTGSVTTGSVTTGSVTTGSVTTGADSGQEFRWCQESYGSFAASWTRNGYDLLECTSDGWPILQKHEEDGTSCVVLHPTYGFAIWMKQAEEVPNAISFHRLIPRRTTLGDGQDGKVRLVVDQTVLSTETVSVHREAMELPSYRTMLDLAPASLSELGPGASLWVAISDGDDVDVWQFSLKGSRAALERSSACMGAVE